MKILKQINSDSDSTIIIDLHIYHMSIIFLLRSNSIHSPVCKDVCLSVRCPVQIYKIIFTKPMPRQNYCWQCCGLVCLLHVVVWNPPFISKDSVTVIEDDWTGTPHKMPACLSVHKFYTPQLLRQES